MKSFKFKVNGNEYKTDIKSVRENKLSIEVNGVEYEVDIGEKENKTPVLAVPGNVSSSIETNLKTSKPGAAQPNSIKAPIPGTVLKINCKKGDAVEAGDTVMLLEAMKMQNEINAAVSGKIDSIEVKEGDSVMEGDTLLIIDY